jgi:hypothetical protein
VKVRVALTVDIDTEAWEADFGVERTELRADVQEYVHHMVQDQLRQLGLLKGEH